MKKILLASTILAGTASFAAADTANFSFSGAAGFGFVYYMPSADGEDNVLTPTVNAEFTAAMTTTTDMGLEAGASVTVTAGSITVETDPTDGDFGVATIPDGQSISDASVYLSGDFGKLAVELDGTDVDYTYTNTWGDFGLEVYYNMIDVAGYTGDDDEFGGKLSYAFGDYNVYAGLDATLDPVLDTDMSYYIGGDATFSSVTVNAEVTFDPAEIAGADDTMDYELGLAYAAGAYSFGATVYGSNVADDELDFELSASYDLGGGVSVDAGYAYDGGTNGVDGSSSSLASLGVSMSF